MSRFVITLTRPKFPLGEIVITANAQSRLGSADVQQAISRDARGEWGELCAEDRKQNEDALARGGRLLSVFRTGESRFWVITECDRSVTTVLMPEDY